jgi:hypothetical protein
MTGLQMQYSGRPQEALDNCAKLVIGASRRVSLERPWSSGESVIQLAGVLRLVAAGDQFRLLIKVSGSAPTLLQAEAWREGLAEQADRQLAATGAHAPLQQVTPTAQAFLLSTARNAPSGRNSTTTA